MTNWVTLGKTCTSLEPLWPKGEKLPSREVVELNKVVHTHFIHALIKCLYEQLLSTYCVPSADIGTGDTEGFRACPQGLAF